MVDDETECVFQRLLDERDPDRDLTARERRQLKLPVVAVQPCNIFTSHLSKHFIFEEETDRRMRRRGHYYRPVEVIPVGRLTEEQIAAHEDRLGIRLPMPWREVYRHFNGGWAATLYRGDMNDPRIGDLKPVPERHEYLALEDVAPLRDLLAKDRSDLDWGSLDPRLIAIAYDDGQAMVLDDRDGEPRICRAFFSRYDDDPLTGWSRHRLTFWWPDMRVFFRGLYLQDRLA